MMNQIFIRCPTTGKLVFTGFAMEKSIFENLPAELSAIKCPNCGQEHEWQKKDAIFGQSSPLQ